MQLQECYGIFGGSYQDVKSRLMNDALIQRLVVKFPDDMSFEGLSQAMERKDYGEAFRAAHTLKGVCMNLGFDCLSRSLSAMTETLRRWESEPVDEEQCKRIWQQISADYEAVISAISKLKESAASSTN